MRVLVLALCAGLATALPTSHEVHTPGVYESHSDHAIDEASYFYSTEGESIRQITVDEAPQYDLVCVPSKELVNSAQIIVQEHEEEEEEGASAASAAAGGAASSAAAGGGAASSAAAGLGAASSAAAGEGAASSAAAGEGAASSAAAGEGAAASSAAASEGAASSAAAGESAASSAAASEGAASSAAAGESAASSAAASEGAASSAAAGEGAASSAAAGESAASSAAASEGAAASSAAGGGAAASSAAGEGVASSAAAGEGAAASSAAGEGAASSAAAGEGAAASSAAGEGAAASSAAGEGAAASSAAGEGAASSAAAGEGAAASAAAGAGAAASAAAGAGASATAAIYVESYDGPDDLDKCTCVPYYLCKDENIISDGAGQIDIRFGDAPGPTNSKCSHFESVCCLKPEDRPLPWIVEELTAEPYYPNCGKRNPEGFGFGIQGFKDSESQFAEFPYMAIIMEEEYVGGTTRNRYVCGGSLVSERVILTAAHCVAGKDTSKLVVRLGDWNTKSTTELLPHQEYHVKRAAVHEAFNSRSLFNTVALLLLDRNVEFQPHIDTICLPSLSDVDGRVQFYDPRHCVATGFGRDQFEGGHYQNIMKQVDLAEVPHDTCQKKLRKTRLGRWFRLHSSFTCAGGKPGVDTCRGDGGGPLVCPLISDPSRYVQVGIVAWGIGCGQGGVPGVYASTSKLARWIHEHLDELMHYQEGETYPTETHESVQVCLTQNPYTEHQEVIPIKIGHPPPHPEPYTAPEPEYPPPPQQGGY